MKKVIMVFLVIVMLTSVVLSGCQSDKPVVKETGATTVSAETKSAPKERVKLRVFVPGSSFFVPEDVDVKSNKWVNFYYKAFPNVDFEWIVGMVGENQPEKKALMIASNDLPDMMPANAKDIITWSDSGIIVPVDDVMNKHYPNIKNFLTEDDIRAGASYNGKLWALLTPENALNNPTGMHIRKDWLQNLNLKIPETIDELYEVMKAFTLKDPDGNGKNDTFGLGSPKNLGNLGHLLAAFDVIPGYWSRVNGKLVPDFIRPEMKQALEFIKKLYADGLYHKDSITQEAAKFQTNLRQIYGIVGASTFSMAGTYNMELKKISPTAEYAYLPSIKGPDGKQRAPLGRNIGNRYVITKACKNPEVPAQILNYLLEQDKTKEYYYYNMDIFNCGIPGVDSDIIGKYVINKPAGSLEGEVKKDQYRFAYRLMYGSANSLPGEHQIKVAEARVASKLCTQSFADAIKNDDKYGHYDDRIIMGPVETEFMAALTTYFDSLKLKIISGEEPIQAFEQWVDYFYKNNGQKIVDEANKMNPPR